MPSTTGSVQDNKKRVLAAQYPAYKSLNDLWHYHMEAYLSSQGVPYRSDLSNSDLEHLYYAEHTVPGRFPTLAATSGYSVNDLKKIWLTMWAGSAGILSTGKSVNDLDLAYWRFF